MMYSEVSINYFLGLNRLMSNHFYIIQLVTQQQCCFSDVLGANVLSRVVGCSQFCLLIPVLLRHISKVTCHMLNGKQLLWVMAYINRNCYKQSTRAKTNLFLLIEINSQLVIYICKVSIAPFVSIVVNCGVIFTSAVAVWPTQKSGCCDSICFLHNLFKHEVWLKLIRKKLHA